MTLDSLLARIGLVRLSRLNDAECETAKYKTIATEVLDDANAIVIAESGADETKRDTWRCYNNTWEPFHETFRIWREIRNLDSDRLL